MSILFKTSAIEGTTVEDPKGFFNPITQLWETIETKISNYADFLNFSGTNSSITYSSTTNIGKDNDTDDTGT